MTAHGDMTEVRFGMSLRDYFAAQAMQSLIVSGKPLAIDYRNVDSDSIQYRDAVAIGAFIFADAMIAARKR